MKSARKPKRAPAKSGTRRTTKPKTKLAQAARRSPFSEPMDEFPTETKGETQLNMEIHKADYPER
jgi:hypothetical protein